LKKRLIILLVFAFGLLADCKAQLPDIVSVIRQAITEVIKAVDLEVQRLQTQTIWLQNAQKALENSMSKLHLDEITSWVQQQKDLYQQYYQELATVKQIIADYEKVKQIISLQARIVSEYNHAMNLFRQDKNFSPAEISSMASVYSGILDQSLKNVQQVLQVVNAFVTTMSDGQRLSIIDGAAIAIRKNYDDLRQFNRQNIALSLQRASENNDINSVKQLYGLP